MHRRLTPSPRPAAWRGLAALMLLALAAVPFVRAQEPVAKPAAPKTAADAEALAVDKKILADAKVGSEIMANLSYISDVIGPRLTGSANLKRANEYAAEKMKSYGLTNVHLEPWSIPAGWERGTATARLLEPDNGRSILMASAGWTPGTKGKVEGEVVILNARTSADLAKYKGKLKNAIVLQSPPQNVRPITDNSYPGVFAPPAGGDGQGRGQGRGRRGQGRGDQPPAQAQQAQGQPPAQSQQTQPPARQQAQGQPPAQGQTPAQGQQPGQGQRGFGRGFGPEFMAFRRELGEFLRSEGVAVTLQDSGKPHGLLVTTGGWRGNDRGNSAEPIPSLFVAHEHYALLYRLASRPAPAKTRLEIEVTNKMVPGPIVVYNTIGEIRGSEKPNEFVIVGAHIDSWDLAQGTTDNGTGTCIVLETARILAKCGVKPKRTIRFCLFSGEEQGLYGSRAYVAAHKDELPYTSLAIVHDTGTGKVVGMGLQGRAAIKPIFEKELVSLKDIGVSDFNLRSMGGSDHQSFDSAGVPGFAMQQDPAEYRLTHHTQSDTLDKAREPDLIQGSQVMAVTAMRVANLPNLLPRDKPAREGGFRGQ